MALTKLTHPDDPDASIEVEEDRVPLFVASGWVVAPGPKTPKK